MVIDPVISETCVPFVWGDLAADLERRALAATPLLVVDVAPAPGLSPADQVRRIGVM